MLFIYFSNYFKNKQIIYTIFRIILKYIHRLKSYLNTYIIKIIKKNYIKDIPKLLYY